MIKIGVKEGLVFYGICIGVGSIIAYAIISYYTIATQFPDTLIIFWGDESGMIMPIGQAFYVFQVSILPALFWGLIGGSIGFVVILIIYSQLE